MKQIVTQLLHDAFATIKLVQTSREQSLTAWLYVPFGVLVVLAICFGVNTAISLSHVSIPASVACMVLLFLALLLFQALLGDRKTRSLVRVIDVPVSNDIVCVLTKFVSLTFPVWFCSSIYQYLLHSIFRTVASQSAGQ